MFKISAILATLMFLAAPTVQATDLKLTCTVQQTTGGKQKTEFKRRFEIDFEPRYFRTFVDTGKGFRGKDEGFPVDINNMRIVFIDNGNISQYYDRATHEYIYTDVAAGIDAKGKCTEDGATGKQAPRVSAPAR